MDKTDIADMLEKQPSSIEFLYQEKKFLDELYTEYINSNTQEYKKKANCSDYSQKLFFSKGGFKANFFKNLTLFYATYTLILLLKLGFTIGIYIQYSVPLTYLWVNILSILFLLILSGILLKYVRKAKSNIKTCYIVLICITILYLSICDPKNLGLLLDNETLSTEIHSNVIYIIIIAVLLKDLLFNSYLGTVIIGMFSILVPVITNLAITRADFISFISEISAVSVIIIYLILISSRQDLKQKALFKLKKDQNVLANELQKDQENTKKIPKVTYREIAISRCDSIIAHNHKLFKFIIGSKLIKENARIIKEIKDVKDIIFEWPLYDNEESHQLLEIGNSNSFATDESFYIEEFRRHGLIKLNLDKTGSMEGFGGDWNFDVFSISQDNSFVKCVNYLFFCSNLKSILKLPNYQCTNFFESLEKKYKDNPYHNHIHAIDVLHSYIYFLSITRIVEDICPLDFLSCIISSLGHDINHPGLDNFFQKLSKSELSLIYNDKSILENMHCSEIFNILLNEDNNLACNLDKDSITYVRKLIIELILHTDFSFYLELSGKMRTLVNSKLNLNFKNPKHKDLILIMGLNCADIGHAAKEKNLYVKWTRLVTQEYATQVEFEKNYGFHRKDDHPLDIVTMKSHLEFLNTLALPMYTVWNQYLNNNIEESVTNLLNNIAFTNDSYLNISKNSTSPELKNFQSIDSDQSEYND